MDQNVKNNRNNKKTKKSLEYLMTPSQTAQQTGPLFRSRAAVYSDLLNMNQFEK